MSDASSVTALAFFFDDVRLELGNKISLMGQYIADAVFADPAIPMDRLAVLLCVRWPSNYEIRNCFARVDIPGQPKSEYQELPLQGVTDVDVDGSVFAVKVLQAVLNLRFPPLRSGDKIDVWFMTDGREYAAGRLKVKGPPGAGG